MSIRDAARPLPGPVARRPGELPSGDAAAVRGEEAGPADEALLQRARQGERAAFRQLIERYQRRVYRMAFALVRDHDEALDVVQETFVKVHQHLAGFKGESSFYTWVYRIARNVAIDSLRRRGGRGEQVMVQENTLTDEGVRPAPAAPHSPGPQRAALRAELARELEAALAKLPEKHRTILVLREIEGLSYEELARVLEIPKGTVMSRLFHARHKMQAALRGYLDEEDLARLANDDEGGE